MPRTINDPTLGAQHKRFVDFEIIIRMPIPNTKPRKRGGKVTRREALTAGDFVLGGQRILIRADHSLRVQGIQGLWQALNLVTETVMQSDKLRLEWVNIP